MSQSQRQFDQPTGGQYAQQGQYQQPPPGVGGQQLQGGLQQPTAGGGGQSTPGQQTTASQQPMASQRTTGGEAQIGGQAARGGRQSLLFPTQNYLPEDVRVPIAETLNRVLADTTILQSHAKFAHWNLKGSDFYGLHELFDEIAEDLAEHADLVGERIAALGVQAMGTAGMAVENCSLPQMRSDAVTGVEYVEILANELAIHDANLHDAIQTAQGYGDADTADLLNEVSREVTQDLWFLEAHLQTEPVGTVPAVEGAGGQQGGGQPKGGEVGGGQPGGGQQARQPPRTEQPGAQYPTR